MKKTKSKVNVLERTDDYEELGSHYIASKEDNNNSNIKAENKTLQFLLGRYNFILSEYQLKYGNELFDELEKQLNIEALDSTNLNDFKKILVENVSLIKEYEKNNLEKEKAIEFYVSELNRLQTEVEKLVNENNEVRNELEIAKE